jgi:hypothetical protein
MKEKSRYCYKVFWTLVEHLDVFDKYKYNYGAVASCHVLPFLSPTTGSRNIRLKRHVQVLQTLRWWNLFESLCRMRSCALTGWVKLKLCTLTKARAQGIHGIPLYVVAHCRSRLETTTTRVRPILENGCQESDSRHQYSAVHQYVQLAMSIHAARS